MITFKEGTIVLVCIGTLLMKSLQVVALMDSVDLAFDFQVINQ